jgi:hypothetical protein
MAGQAPVNLGAFARGGQTRGAHQASEHDLGCKENAIPGGLVDEDTAPLSVPFGSSFKTRDVIGETLAAWWQGLSATEPGASDRVQSKLDNGSERRGVRPPGLQRLVQCAETIGKPLQRLDYPP